MNPVPKAIRVLIAEDDSNDAELLVRALREGGYEPDWRRVDTEAGFVAALEELYDLVISDYVMPGFGGLRALALLKEREIKIPFILVSGVAGEDLAVTAMKLGAADYLLKDRLTLLGSAVGHALLEAQAQRERLAIVGHALLEALMEEQLRRERLAADAALRESEARFLQVVESMREVFWMTDAGKTRMLYISPGFEAIWGRTCESITASLAEWADSIHPEDRTRVLEAARTKQVLGTYEEEYRIVRPDGTIRWVRDRASPVRNAGGEISRVVGVAEDITQRKELEQQFRQAQKMESIGTLAGGIAHDFNNILTAIGGYTELARGALDDRPEVQELLEAVLAAAGRATGLVRQILAFSRQQPIERRLIQLGPIVAESFALLRASIPSTIEFEKWLAGDAPTVFADPGQVHQCLMNLGTNAWHAMKDGSGLIRITLEKCEIDAAQAAASPQLRPGSYVRVSVRDSGKGMDKATLQRIFDPFFTTKPPGEGTGLGLAVVHGIMVSHEGAVTVESQPDEGTTFHLYFPAHSAEATAEPAQTGEFPRGHGERILVVDDEETLVTLAMKTLVNLGYQAEGVTQPASALAMVRADPGRFALVITDMTMPVMTGMQLATILLHSWPGLPVILMTGYSATISPELVKAAGIRSLVLKPANLRSIAIAVNAALSAPAR